MPDGMLKKLQLDIADFDRGVILPVAARNLVLIALLELEHGELLAAALRDDFAAHGSFAGIGARYHLLVVHVDGQDRAKIHFFPYFAIHPLDTDGVAGRDAILLSPGLNNGVHLSSKPLRQTLIIRVPGRNRQRTKYRVFKG